MNRSGVPHGSEAEARRGPVRRAVRDLVVGVALLDAAAGGLYALAGLAHASERTRTTFVVVWMLATVLVVVPLLSRVRRSGRRTPSAPSPP